MPGGVGEFGAVCHIAEEDLAHLLVDIAIVDEEVTFEVVLEASEVEVGRSGCHQVVVDHHRLGMEHTGVVEIHFDACLEALCHV